MIKRHIIETIYEYDNEGKLIKKTVTETNEEDTPSLNNITIPCNPYPHGPTGVAVTPLTNVIEKDKITLSEIAKSTSSSFDTSGILAMSTPASLDNYTADVTEAKRF